jgi:hypothetical protein
LTPRLLILKCLSTITINQCRTNWRSVFAATADYASVMSSQWIVTERFTTMLQQLRYLLVVSFLYTVLYQLKIHGINSQQYWNF